MKKKAEQETLMIQYLLGELSEEDRLRLEARFFSDDADYQQLLALEDELRYDYAQGGLTPQQRQRFEQRFLASPEDRERVEVAKAILDRIATARVEAAPAPIPARREKISWWASLLPFITLQNPAMRYSLAAAALLLMLGGSLLLFEAQRLRSQIGQLQAAAAAERQASQQQIAEQRDRHNQLNAEFERERGERSRLEQELARQQAAPGQRTPLSLLAFVLSPGLVRDIEGPKRLVIPPGIDSLRLQLETRRNGEYNSYRAALQTLDNEELWSQLMTRAQLTATGQSLTLSLPARLFTSGDYVIKIKGIAADGNSAEVGDYYFSIVKT